MLHDLWLSLRALKRRPIFVGFAVTTLAIGFGAHIALMALTDAVVRRPIVSRQPERLVAVFQANEQGQMRAMPLDAATALVNASGTLESWCGYEGAGLFTLHTPQRTALTAPEFVTGEYFALLEARVRLGRFFGDAEVNLRDRVAVVSEAFWDRSLSSDPNVIGSEVKINGLPVTVIGVAASPFRGLQSPTGFDIVLPVTLVPEILRRPPASRASTSIHYIIGRLRPDVTEDQARLRFETKWQTIRDTAAPAGSAPQAVTAFRKSVARLDPIGMGFWSARKTYVEPLKLLSALSLLIVVLSGLNIAGLMLVRAIEQQHTYALRTALGSTAAAQIVALCAEATVLSIAGATLAMPVAWILSSTIGKVMWTGVLPLSLIVTPSPETMINGALVCVVVGLLAGLIPGMALRHLSVPQLLTDSRSTAGPHQHRLARLVVAGQIALCALLMLGAAAAGTRLLDLRRVDVGVATSDLAAAKLSPQPLASTADESSYWATLLEDAGRLSNVRAVSMSRFFPALADESSLLEPITRADGGEGTVLGVMEVIGPRFFATTRIPVLRGSDFAWNDPRLDGGRAILNKSAALALFGSTDVIGEYVRIGSDPRRRRAQVVAVAGDATLGNPRAGRIPIVYRFVGDEPALGRASTLIIRTAPGTRVSADDLNAVVGASRRHYLQSLRGVGQQLSMSIARERTAATLGIWFALLAAIIALAGMNVVATYTAARRAHEFGVRLALGGRPSSIIRQVLVDGMLAAGIGIGVAGVLFLALKATIEARMTVIGAVDPLSAAIVALALMGLAGAASAAPALRASQVDPARLLRKP
jgi:predicted permease